jgi:hypothetical protein
MIVKLDGKMSSLLDFRSGRHEALTAIAKGEPLSFEIDLGLDSFSGREVELKALSLALNHFVESLWEEFRPYIHEVIIYRGPLPENEITFSAYLKGLKGILTASIPVAICFETRGESPLTRVRKSSASLFPGCRVYVDGKEPEFDAEARIGFLIPSENEEAYESLLKKGHRVRLVEEAFLISDWHGLDYLIVDPKFIDNEALRKLKGFNAAGGRVVSLGAPLGLFDEIGFDREMSFPHL